MTEDTPVIARESCPLFDSINALLDIKRHPVIEGWPHTTDKAIAMANLVVAVRPELIVEIGVFGGRSLLPQALALQHLGRGLIIGIDPWTHESALEGDVGAENAEWWAKQDLDAIANGCWNAIMETKLDPFAVLMRAQSHIVAPLFRPGQIDILEIDGNHSELASCRDVTTYLPLVRGGGHVWMDDSTWKTTQKAVGLLEDQCDRIDQVGDCVLFRKRLI